MLGSILGVMPMMSLDRFSTWLGRVIRKVSDAMAWLIGLTTFLESIVFPANTSRTMCPSSLTNTPQEFGFCMGVLGWMGLR